MALTRREKYIAATTLAVMVIMLADRMVITPWLRYRTAMSEEIDFLSNDLERTRILIARQDRFSPVWDQALGETLHFDRAAAESQILHAVRAWARASGLNVVSIRPERIIQHDRMEEMVFQLSGQGSLAAVVEFLFRLESSPLPVKAVELQLGTRTEGRDDLVLQLKLSTLAAAAGED